MFAIISMLLAVGGGEPYTLVSDNEWPGADTSIIIITNDTYNSVMTDGGQAIGSQTLFGYDGGVIIDPKGLYFVRGPINVWGNIHSWALGFPDTTNGGKYEVCYTPSYSSAQWNDGVNPNWDGAHYIMDVNMVTQHTVAFILGAYSAGNLYVRLNGSGATTYQIPVLWVAGQNYCVSAEWVPTSDVTCDSYIRYDSCEQTPTPYCKASTIVGYEHDGACPSPTPNYVTLGQRQSGYDTSDMVPTTIHISAVRSYSK